MILAISFLLGSVVGVSIAFAVIMPKIDDYRLRVKLKEYELVTFRCCLDRRN